MARIIFESNKCNNIELEERDITIDDNGTYAITPNVGYAGMSKVDVNVDVDTLQGLNFEGVYDAEQANEINQHYKDGIEYAKSIVQEYQGIQIKNLSRAFQNNNNLVYMPNIDLSETTSLFFTWHTCANLQYVGRLESRNVTDMYAAFYRCYKLQEVDIDTSSATTLQQAFFESSSLTKIVLSSVEKCTSFSNTFYANYSLIHIKFEKWKQANISLSYSANILPEYIHFIIQNAVDIADGATARTLTLQAAAKTNWQNSEYYQEDLAVLSTKGITIA